MRLTFRASYRDFADVSYHSWNRRNKASKYIGGFAYLSAVIGIVSSLPVWLFLTAIWRGFVTFLISSFLTFFVFYRSIPSKRYFLKEYKKLLNAGEDIETVIDLADDGVSVEHLGQKTLFRWQILTGYEETSERFFFYAAPSGGFGVPKRAFETNDQMGNFIAFSKSRLQLQG